MVYHLNIAAVAFEQKNYSQCIDACALAIKKSKKNYPDFTLIAKAYGRMGKGMIHNLDPKPFSILQTSKANTRLVLHIENYKSTTKVKEILCKFRFGYSYICSCTKNY